MTHTTFTDATATIGQAAPVGIRNAAPGTMCVCIDDHWFDTSGSDADGPKCGTICTIENIVVRGGATWIKIKGFDGHLEATAFRPATFSELIAEYRVQTGAFDQLHTDGMTFAEEQELADRTYEPALLAFENPPAVATRDEAVAALELVLENEPFASESDPALVRRVLEYIRQG